MSLERRPQQSKRDRGRVNSGKEPKLGGWGKKCKNCSQWASAGAKNCKRCGSAL